MEGEIMLIFIIVCLIGIPLFLYSFMSSKKSDEDE